jgi:hypothetical protein
MYVLLAVAVGVAVWSAIHGVRTREKSASPLTARHTSAIGYATAAVVATVMAISYLCGSTAPVVSNGAAFTDALWLRLTDMFIYTSLLLVCLCSAIVVVAKFRR